MNGLTVRKKKSKKWKREEYQKDKIKQNKRKEYPKYKRIENISHELLASDTYRPRVRFAQILFYQSSRSDSIDEPYRIISNCVSDQS